MIIWLIVLSVLIISGFICVIFCNIETEKTKRLKYEVDFDWQKTLLKKSSELFPTKESINDINLNLKEINEAIKQINSRLNNK